MRTQNFQSLIQAITGRDLVIHTNDAEIIGGQEYWVYRVLPITQRKVSFKWKAALSDEKMLRSFITCFCTKYTEPDPNAYSEKSYGGGDYSWAAKTDEQKEYAYNHHRSNMFDKDALMKQIEANFEKSDMKGIMCRYGFYETEYGIGIFSLFASDSIISAIQDLKDYLQAKGIVFSNEFSEARWVYRFKLNISKPIHGKIIDQFNQK